MLLSRTGTGQWHQSGLCVNPVNDALAMLRYPVAVPGFHLIGNETEQVSSCTLRPEWTLVCYQGVPVN
jgi:hypothetical protein